MNVLQHTRDKKNPFSKEDQQVRSYKDCLSLKSPIDNVRLRNRLMNLNIEVYFSVFFFYL